MGGLNVKNTMLDRVLAVVAPHPCLGCDKLGTPLCTYCKYNITSRSFSRCIVCNQPSLVGVCIEHNKTYQNAWIVGSRRGVLQLLIGNLKFQNMKEAAGSLAQLLDARLPQFSNDTILVPIPTAPAHIRERGYDHALLIARYLAGLRQLPLERVLARRDTKTQHHANRADRITQARSAFRLDKPVDPAKRYVIIDDVYTTGATIDAASQFLKAAGARFIGVAILARQPLD